jgi:hypothetical protein
MTVTRLSLNRSCAFTKKPDCATLHFWLTPSRTQHESHLIRDVTLEVTNREDGAAGSK